MTDATCRLAADPSGIARRERTGALLDGWRQKDRRLQHRPNVARRSAAAAPRRRSVSNSRPPMKRAEGTGSPKALTLTSVSRAGSSSTFAPPIAIEITQVPVETTEKGCRPAEQMRQQRGVGIVDAAMDRRVGGQPGRGGDLRQDRPEPIAARRTGAISARQPMPIDQRREIAACGRPRGRCGSRARSPRWRGRR